MCLTDTTTPYLVFCFMLMAIGFGLAFNAGYDQRLHRVCSAQTSGKHENCDVELTLKAMTHTLAIAFSY
jgi:hypothetical protein